MDDDTEDGVRVFIVAELRFVRDGLAMALAHDDRISIVGSARTLGEALSAIPSTGPTAILVDVGLPEGVWAIERLAALDGARVVALAVPDLEADVLACAEAGASAYVTREQPLSAVAETILGVARGEAICSARMAASLLRRIAALAVERRPEPPDRRLTERELEVVGLIDQGLSNKQIAGRLGIEVSTVKNHVHNILEKLQVNRRGEAAARVRDGSVARALADRAPSPVGGFRGRVVVRTRPGDAALLRRDRRGAFQRSPQS